MASGTLVRWKGGKDPVAVWIPNTQRWANSLVQMVFDVVSARAEEIKQWMKDNHVWKNRTHLAEEQLDTAVRRDGTLVTLYMYHGADVAYSRFLERYMQGGRFSVLRPALDYWGSILLDDVRKKLS
jgi:hypothetical protein